MVNRQDRAKQFMPFDALKGLQEELRIREERRTRVEKKTLSEEQIEKISALLYRIRNGSKVAITFYSRGHYLSIDGYISEVNQIYGYIKLGNEKVFFDDIYKLRIIEI